MATTRLSLTVRNANDLTVEVLEDATIHAVSVAASVAVAAGTTFAAGVSGAGAEATNIILTKTNAYADNSRVSASHDALLTSTNTAEIKATIKSLDSAK